MPETIARRHDGTVGPGFSDPRIPGWPLFWIPLLIFDAILLAALPEAVIVVGLAFAIPVVIALLRRPEVALAMAAAGFPLLEPLSRSMPSEAPVFFLGRFLVAGPLIIVGWNRIWGSRLPGGRTWYRDPIILWALALGVVLFAGLGWTQSPNYGLMKVRFYFAVNLLLLVGAFFLLRRDRCEDGSEDRSTDGSGERSADRSARDPAVGFLAALVWLQLAIAVTGVLNWFFGFYEFKGRLVTLGLNTIWLARHMGLGILVVLAMHAMGTVRLRFVVPAILLLGVVFFLAGSRGPTLALAGALLLWIALTPRAGRHQGWTAAVLVLVGLGALSLLLFSPGIQERVYPASGRQVSDFVRRGLLSLSRRALSGLDPRGLGPGGFSHLAGYGDLRFYPHNLFLEVLIENGLFGIVALFGFLGAVFTRWLRWGRGLADRADSPRERVLHRTAITLLAYAMINAQFSGDINVNEWIWLVGGAIAAWSWPSANRAAEAIRG